MIEISCFDFNAKLFELLDKEDKDDKNICLITNNTLENDHVKLSCGHAFNYGPLFNEVVKQKCTYNSLEVTRLKNNEIKCPYCRTIQKGLLPYNDRFEKKKFVNHPVNLQCLPNNCTYVFLTGKIKEKM